MISREMENSESGFTLIEVLIAILILVVGIMAVANLFVVATSSNGIANNETGTTVAAAQQLELLKAQPFTALVVGGSLTADVPNFNSDTIIKGLGDVHTRWQVSQLDGDTLAITVQSDGPTPFARSIARSTFTTIRACTSKAYGCGL